MNGRNVYGLLQWLLLTPLPKQSISENSNVPPTIFPSATAILSSFLKWKSRCINGSIGHNFKLLVKQEFQATRKIMGPRPMISLENLGKMLALSEKGYSQQKEEGISVMDWPAQ